MLSCSAVTDSFVFVIQLLSVQLFVIPWAAACQAPMSFTISWSLLKLMSIELVMPSNHLILCRPFLLLPSVFPSIRVFSSESALRVTRLLCPWNFPGKNSGVGCPFLLQGVFLTQASNPCLLCLLHWQADFFLLLAYLGIPGDGYNCFQIRCLMDKIGIIIE